jgi:hypothetical protein
MFCGCDFEGNVTTFANTGTLVQNLDVLPFDQHLLCPMEDSMGAVPRLLALGGKTNIRGIDPNIGPQVAYAVVKVSWVTNSIYRAGKMIVNLDTSGSDIDYRHRVSKSTIEIDLTRKTSGTFLVVNNLERRADYAVVSSVGNISAANSYWRAAQCYYGGGSKPLSDDCGTFEMEVPKVDTAATDYSYTTETEEYAYVTPKFSVGVYGAHDEGTLTIDVKGTWTAPPLISGRVASKVGIPDIDYCDLRRLYDVYAYMVDKTGDLNQDIARAQSALDRGSRRIEHFRRQL